jgi:hypothetical protein
MAIVSVAIVLSFHLKSKPSALGKLSSQLSLSTILIQHRKALRFTTRYHLLASIPSMHGVRIIQLHQYGIKIQSTASVGANGVEDAVCIHCGIECYSSDVCLVPLYRCEEVEACSRCLKYLSLYT